MTVYVVDDQLVIVEMLTLLLSELGVEASGTTVSGEAHQAIAALRPDLVLLERVHKLRPWALTFEKEEHRR